MPRISSFALSSIFAVFLFILKSESHELIFDIQQDDQEDPEYLQMINEDEINQFYDDQTPYQERDMMIIDYYSTLKPGHQEHGGNNIEHQEHVHEPQHHGGGGRTEVALGILEPLGNLASGGHTKSQTSIRTTRRGSSGGSSARRRSAASSTRRRRSGASSTRRRRSGASSAMRRRSGSSSARRGSSGSSSARRRSSGASSTMRRRSGSSSTSRRRRMGWDNSQDNSAFEVEDEEDEQTFY